MNEKQKWSNPEASIHCALAQWAASCAEHTLFLFESQNPGDKRPRIAIETLRAWVRGERTMVECRKAAFAAHAAAREATSLVAIAAARPAGQAAAVAHMWNHAPHAATYAAKAVALAGSKSNADAAQTMERRWQREQLREDLHSLGFPLE